MQGQPMLCTCSTVVSFQEAVESRSSVPVCIVCRRLIGHSPSCRVYCSLQAQRLVPTQPFHSTDALLKASSAGSTESGIVPFVHAFERPVGLLVVVS